MIVLYSCLALAAVVHCKWSKTQQMELMYIVACEEADYQLRRRMSDECESLRERVLLAKATIREYWREEDEL